MMASLSKNSLKQYNVCIKKWWTFSQANSIDIYKASVPTVLYFLTQQFNDNAQYGTFNSCRAALSLVLGQNITNDDRIQRFFKGVSRLRPPLPKYNASWDTNLVLDLLSSWYPNENLTLERLARKAVTLLALTTAHRIQTLSKILIKNVEFLDEHILIKIPGEIKTSRLGARQPIHLLPFFISNQSICPTKTLIAYINKTKPIRKTDTLWLGLKKPHNPVFTQSLSRWIKRTLSESGIDVAVFSAHSTRHAAASRALSLGVSIDSIRNTAALVGATTQTHLQGFTIGPYSILIMILWLGQF
ncbi:hypothetical protein O3G_MSEX009849 [Manduca sexta]|uniref:Tyr recombinase domain-containing protein n=1 Tax=Manduca sexta TaxID=7130 RepID=A0A921ZFF6_MANSE|nr:hypothetical protein O3G_MSEX009849 [Manduca sexta]